MHFMSNEPPPPRPLRIVIVGAGLVGALTAVLLSRLANVQVTVYERTEKLHEVGAWIAVTNSSFQILRQIIDIDELNSIVYRGSDYKTSVTRHWQTGEILHVQRQLVDDVNLVEARTQRVALHNLILKYVPDGVIKYSHKVTSVDRGEGNNVFLKFANGKPSLELDMVIAADGIYSKIRRQFFTDNSNEIKYKGTVLYRTVFPESLVSGIENLPDDTSSWVKPNGDVIFLSRLGLQKYGVVALIKEPLEVAQLLKWNDPIGELGKLKIVNHFKNWDPIISKVLSKMPNINSYPLETAKWVDKLCIDDNIVFVGDAAHPTAGAYGAGSSFGFADAWALYRSLQEIWERDCSISMVLSLYNRTRMPFLQRVERQIRIDSQISKELFTKIDNEDEWRRLMIICKQGGDWMKSHNVELEFQDKRDEQLFEILQKIHQNLSTSSSHDRIGNI